MMFGKYPVLRFLIDTSAPLALSMALFAIYLMDLNNINRTVLHSKDESDQISPESHMADDRDQVGVDPAVPLSIDPAQLEALMLQGESLSKDPIVGATQAERDTEILGAVRNSPPLSTIPAEPPPLLNTLEPPKQTESVSFFHLEEEAHRIVFLVDGSSSMIGNRFERARAELARAIGALNQYQTFSVAFFNHGFDYMPMPGGDRHLLTKTTAETKAKAIAWMLEHHAQGGTNPEPALTVAAHLRPEVIFLLTDGEFHPLSSQTLNLLRDNGVKVDTIGFDSRTANATLENISLQTGGKYRSAMAEEAADPMFLASNSAVFAALDDQNAKTRLAAVIVAFTREMTYVRKTKFAQASHKLSPVELKFVRKMPDMLNDSDDRVRREVHHRLVSKALGSNFGPNNFDDPADVTLAVKRWTQWCSCFFEHDQPQVVKALSAQDTADQWAAASVIRIAGWDVPDELVANLGLVSSEARTEIRAALRALAGGKDFGPEQGANDEQVAKAVGEWKAWRTAVKQQAEEERLAKLEKAEKERLAKLEKDASTKLNVGDMYWNSGRAESKEKARKIWEEIIKKFPGTLAANSAEKRLQQ